MTLDREWEVGGIAEEILRGCVENDLVYNSLSTKSIDYRSKLKVNAFKGELTETQGYLLTRIVETDSSWERLGLGGVITLNKRYGAGPVTEALQALRLEPRVARNPLAYLWAMVENLVNGTG